MKKSIVFFNTVFFLITCLNLLADGYIQIHNKTKYPAEIRYNYGSKDQHIKINTLENSKILSTNKGFFRWTVGNIKKLDIKLYKNDKTFESRLMENLDIKVENNKITHIYIIYYPNTNKNKIRIATMRAGKIILPPYSKKEDQKNKDYYYRKLYKSMKPRIQSIPPNEKNEKAILIIQNKSEIPLKISTPSISFYEDFAKIKNLYLLPGDYYYQVIDERFEAKNIKIQQIQGSLNKMINKVKIPRGKITKINIIKKNKKHQPSSIDIEIFQEEEQAFYTTRS